MSIPPEGKNGKVKGSVHVGGGERLLLESPDGQDEVEQALADSFFGHAVACREALHLLDKTGIAARRSARPVSSSTSSVGVPSSTSATWRRAPSARASLSSAAREGLPRSFSRFAMYGTDNPASAATEATVRPVAARRDRSRRPND